MQTVKRIWPLIQLLFSVISLVGCASLVTLPLTATPLFLLGIFLLLMGPNLPQSVLTVWQFLTRVVNFQAFFFMGVIGYTVLTETFDVFTGTLKVLVPFDPHKPPDDLSEQKRRAIGRHIRISYATAAVALVPVLLLWAGYYLWLNGWHNTGVALQLLGIISQLLLLIFLFRFVKVRSGARRTLWG